MSDEKEGHLPAERSHAITPQVRPQSARPQSAKSKGRPQSAAGVRDPAGPAKPLTVQSKGKEDVEAKFYGDDKYYPAVLGQEVGTDRVMVMFKGYEADGWQETLSKDIRYVGAQLQLGKGSGPKNDTDKAGHSPTVGPSKPGSKKGNEVKPAKSRSGKKWEVVTSFLGDATGSGGAPQKSSAAPAKSATKQPAPAQQPSQTQNQAASSGAAGVASKVVAASSKATKDESPEAVRQQGGARQAEHSAQAVATVQQEEEQESKEFGVSYDLLTTVSERLEDLGMFDAEQIDEEGVTSIVTTADGHVRFLEMCKRIAVRLCDIEGGGGGRDLARNAEEGLKKLLAERGWPGSLRGLRTARLRFSALEFLVAELQCAQMCVDDSAAATPDTNSDTNSTKNKAHPSQPSHEAASDAGTDADVVEGGGVEGDVAQLVAGMGMMSVAGQSGAQRLRRQLLGMAASIGFQLPSKLKASAIVQQAAQYAATTMKAVPADFLGHILLPKGSLTEDQVVTLSEVSQELRVEYGLRKEMLLKRLGVVASACACSRNQRDGTAAMLTDLVQRQIPALEVQPSFTIYDLYCCKSDLVLPSVAATVTDSSLKKVRIGMVPDRGGRIEDLNAVGMRMEVRRANVAMKGKDAPRGAHGGARGGGNLQGSRPHSAASDRGVSVASGQYHPDYADNSRGGGRAARGARGGRH